MIEMRAAVGFQSTLLMRGATLGPMIFSDSILSYFNPRSSCEERLYSSLDAVLIAQFQSTLLMRGATIGRALVSPTTLFQSTLLMRGATQPDECHLMADLISIHAPHARSDCR